MKKPPSALAGFWGFFPLSTTHGGQHDVLLWNPSESPKVVFYDRGHVGPVQSLDEWIAALLEAWREELSVLRVRWARIARQPTGWHEIQIPTPSKKKFATFASKLAEGSPFKVLGVGVGIRFALGADSTWRVDEAAGGRREVEIALTTDAAAELSKAVTGNGTDFVVADGVELKISFCDR